MAISFFTHKGLVKMNWGGISGFEGSQVGSGVKGEAHLALSLGVVEYLDGEPDGGIHPKLCPSLTQLFWGRDILSVPQFLSV